MKHCKKNIKSLIAFALMIVVSLSAFHIHAAAETDSGFIDVSPDAWYADAVNWCRDNKIMSGMGGNAFSPEVAVTRAMMAMVLYRAAGDPKAAAPNFTDVPADQWYTDAIGWASEIGMTAGYGNGLFGTEDPISREQMVTFLWRYDGSPKVDSPPFIDSAQIEEYAKPAVSWACANNIVSGVGGDRFDPKGSATRAQIAAILKQYLEISGETEKPTPNPNGGVEDLKTSAYTLGEASFTMIRVEGGTFTMGANDRLSDQSPEHKVTLSSYLMGETEVTQALWEEVMGSNPSRSNIGDDYPVENVTWTKSHDFVDRLNERMHTEGLTPDDVNFYIPSEAQWEYAAKGGNKSQGYIYSGSNNLSDVGWTSNEDGRISHKVKLKTPNELGLYDMSGNVYEWVADYYAPYSANAQTNPCNLTNINSSRQVIKRGGSFWYNDAERYTCTYRYAYYENVTDESIGLRICLY